MLLFQLAILGAIIWIGYSLISALIPKPDRVCKACGHVGSPKTVTRGNLLIEIILWLCLLVPGLIYSIWRASSRYSACRSCGSAEVIPTSSPIGQKIIAGQAPLDK